MKYAVISLGGKQHVVTEGEQLTINRLSEDNEFTINDVMLVVDGAKVSVGAPLVAGASVKAKVVEHGKGDKIRVAVYKAKSRYRKVRGHRQPLTTVEITSIVG